MKLTSVVAPVAVAAALALSLTACGSSSGSGGSGDAGKAGGGTTSLGSDYCDNIKAISKSWAAVGDDDFDPTTMGNLAADVAKIQASAPPELKSDWEKLGTVFAKIAKAYQDAGLTQDDIAKMQSGDLSAMQDPAKVGKLQDAMTALSSVMSDADFTQAMEEIPTVTKDKCGIDLNAQER